MQRLPRFLPGRLGELVEELQRRLEGIGGGHRTRIFALVGLGMKPGLGVIESLLLQLRNRGMRDPMQCFCSETDRDPGSNKPDE